MPEEILAFWREAGRERWYRRDAAFDAVVRSRFLALWRQAAAGGLSSWEASDEGALALVIVLDQFPRNMFRDDIRTYSSDVLAREVARRAIDRGADRSSMPPCGISLYAVHAFGTPRRPTALLDPFRNAGNTENLEYAEVHADIIRQFDAFPIAIAFCNASPRPEEQAFLDQGGFSA